MLAVYSAAMRFEFLSSDPCVTSTGNFRLLRMSSMSSGGLESPSRTFGGTIMLKESIVSNSSCVGCREKQSCRKARVGRDVYGEVFRCHEREVLQIGADEARVGLLAG